MVTLDIETGTYFAETAEDIDFLFDNAKVLAAGAKALKNADDDDDE
jgi:hypothetical protein